jgi:tRNA-Thr(GGU) m(6)t(6)A37 methyltransferase TsaA
MPFQEGNLMSHSISMSPIGHIQSCFPEKFGVPKQGRISPHSHGAIHFSEHIDGPAMTAGLESFSHLWVLWLFHQNKNKTLLKKVHPPRLGGKKSGVFASRSPHRPNAIGMTVVQILSIEVNRILISGLDMVEGTPVLDIKPYIPQWDSYPEASSGWLSHQPDSFCPTEFLSSAMEELFAYEKSDSLEMPASEVLHAIRECLSTDPRPPAYKKMDQTKQMSEKPIYAFQIYGLDVKFRKWDNGFLVTRIDKMRNEESRATGPSHNAT